jgi:hypothetical protein
MVQTDQDSSYIASNFLVIDQTAYCIPRISSMVFGFFADAATCKYLLQV